MNIRPQALDLLARLGLCAGVSPWFRVTQDRITAFGGLTLDYDPHHIDPAAAKSGPFGAPTAQGFLTLSLLTHLIEAAKIDIAHRYHINYGFNKVRFIAPVYVGRRIRAEFFYRAAVRRPDARWLVEFDVRIEQEGEQRPCLSADWLILLDEVS